MRTDIAMYKNTIKLVAVAAVLVGAVACTDVTTEPRSTVTGANIFDDPASYRAFLAKLYAGLAVSGQQGPAGQADIEGIDEGFSQYVRGLWQLQTLPTDEAIIGWGDATLPEMNTMEWLPDNRFITAFYYRIFFQVTLVNEFLRETEEARLTERGVSDALRTDIQRYRAEARFLRALSYWHGLDTFGDIPLLTEAHPLGALPTQSERAEIHEFVVDELRDLIDNNRLFAMGAAPYGRADAGAARMLLAKVYMNAASYGLPAQWTQAMTEVQAVIGGPYQLADEHRLNFLADNHTSPEIIFPVPFDGMRTRTYGGTTFLVHAAVGGTMTPANYGINGGWGGLRATQQLVNKFEDGAAGPDARSDIFFTTGHSLVVTTIPNFNHGYAAPKFRNVTSAGVTGSNPDFPDTDFPMFRLADAYLMYAELQQRGGGGTEAAAVDYVNALRERAYGDASGNITAGDLTLQFILDERARELFWEGHRRTDLIRYGLFTGGDYLWAFKGSAGSPDGAAADECRRLYPIPAAELTANRNLSQHACYAG